VAFAIPAILMLIAIGSAVIFTLLKVLCYWFISIRGHRCLQNCHAIGTKLRAQNIQGMVLQSS